jgi:hypothetical protein
LIQSYLDKHRKVHETAYIADGVHVALVAAGSVVSPGTVRPSHELARGAFSAETYCALKDDYLKQRRQA